MPIFTGNKSVNNKGGNYRVNGVLYDTMEEAHFALIVQTMRPLAGSISSVKKTTGRSDKSLSITDKIDKLDSTRG
jgi:hypothetical protein